MARRISGLVLGLVFSFAAGAVAVEAPRPQSTRFVCATAHPTTTLVLIEHSDRFDLQVWHANGVEFMPIHEGVITASDFEVLAANAKVLHQMGARFDISFSKTNCTFQNGMWKCSGNEIKKAGGLDVQGVWFTLSEREMKTAWLNHKTYFARLSVLKDNVGYSMPMEYPADACSLK